MNALAREQRREAMLAKPEAERLAWGKKMAEARAAARERRPERLVTVEDRMDLLGAEYQALPAYPEGQERRREIRRELRDLADERMRLRYGS